MLPNYSASVYGASKPWSRRYPGFLFSLLINEVIFINTIAPNIFN